MRYLLLVLVTIFCGCVATQPPHNPLTKPDPVKEAPVEPAVPAVPATPALSGVELMKEMFLTQRDMKAQILKLAETLTDEELAGLNEWLVQYGVQIRRPERSKPSDVPRPSRVF